MSFSPVLYVGSPGLEADIFVSYMRCAGYPAYRILPSSSPPVSFPEGAIIVISELHAPGLDQLLRQVREQGRECVRQVFLLAGDDEPVAEGDGVRVIRRPFRLSEVVRQIQTLNRRTS